MITQTKSGSSTANREIAVTRLINAPRELLFELWTNPEHIKHWWGPNGFTNTIDHMDVRPGGEWDLVMHGPDGTDYKNKHIFKEVVKPEKLVLMQATAPKFQMTVTFEEQGEKTLLSITSLFESAEQLQEVIKVFKADEGLKQNVQRLEDYIARLSVEKEIVITRIFDAPRQLVWKAWTDPKQLSQWWGPNGFTNPVCKWEAKPGNTIHLDMKAPDGIVYPMDGLFHEVVEPERLVFMSAALDKDGERLFEVLNTVTFTEQDGKTKFTLKAIASKVKLAGWSHIDGADEGWGQSLDRLSRNLNKEESAPLMVTIEKDSSTFHVFDRRVDGQILQFTLANGQLTDNNTGSIWNEDGTCIEGPLKGKQLKRLQAYQEFWHSWKTFHPETGRYR